MVRINNRQPIEFGTEEVMIRKHLLSVARFPAKEMLRNLVAARYRRRGIERLFISVNGFPVPIKTVSQRYQLFKSKCRCVKCGRVGSMMSMDTDVHASRITFHFNLYCIERGRAILMTKDHIMPKSKGGRNQMKNYQTMCEYCNRRKADRIEEN